MKKMEEKIAEDEEEHEARRLKTMAEELYKDSNLDYALKYAKRALNLRPNLDGVSELVMAFTILQIAANGSLPDWYKILQAEPFSHINVVKKQYRKLALLLHPDKNSFVASEEAFKLVGDAFRCLSDKVKRKEYDMKLSLAIQEEAAAVAAAGEAEAEAEAERFTTSCSKCGSSHRFERRYIGHNLMCPSCKKSFVALEVEANNNEIVVVCDDDDDDVTLRDLASASSRVRKRANNEVVECDDDVRLSDLARPSSSRVRKHATNEVVECDEDVRVSDLVSPSRVRKNANTDKLKKVDSKKKMSSVDEVMKKLEKNDLNGGGGGGGGDGVGFSESLSMKRGRTGDEMTLAEFQLEAKRKVVRAKTKVKLIEEKEKEKVKERSRDNLNSLQTPVTEKRSASNRSRGLEIENPNLNVSKNPNLNVSKKSKDLAIETQGVVALKKHGREIQVEAPEPMRKRRAETRVLRKDDDTLEIQNSGGLQGGEIETMTVENSDFYDFDKDRVERSFKQGQVWALYDDDDGMPRHYGLIDGVPSFNPFELPMSWLDLQSNGDHGLVYWEKMGFHISCGRFKVSKNAVINSVTFFSHVVDCERVAREIYRIYPKKGSIWALYKEDIEGGTPCSLSDNNNARCYDIVVFLTSYSEMHGLSVAYLEKVEGYKTVFKRREIGPHAVRWFEKDDIQLFSHQIPARKLPVADTPDSMGDYWELDPASLPRDLLTIM